MLVNFLDDLPAIRDFLADCISRQGGIGKPISAVEIGFRLVQSCHVVFHFDTRETHEVDGTWTLALDGPTLELPHWNQAFEAAEDDGIAFILLTGHRHDLPPGADEEEVADVFGKPLGAIVLDAYAAGSFASLPLRDDCQIDLEEFDALCSWPAYEEAEAGQANILSRLAVRLPLNAKN